ncbi:ABC transporter permease subunit [Ruminococcus sp. 5_1_39BFAA]|uniref:ABC transporter permease subunit n=1 Tax=Ruminococcus sp. 5_1_39BFAA TaxID=457412 RepID=UPI003569A66C
MTIWKHELKTGRISLIIWSAAVAFLMAVCILIYPEMADQMSVVSAIFARMGGFSQAFGMDRINFGEFIGFFGVECGNILGLGGAFFAALLGASALAKEEKDHTAEFLLTHPNSRIKIIGQKLCAVFTQILILNAVVIVITAISVLLIDETVDAGLLALLFLAYFIMQIEVGAICFGISAFVRRGEIGLGLGLAAIFYFLNLIANLTKKAEFLKYITPFSYAESADIIANEALSGKYLAVGIAFAIVGIGAAFWQYGRKDIA